MTERRSFLGVVVAGIVGLFVPTGKLKGSRGDFPYEKQVPGHPVMTVPASRVIERGTRNYSQSTDKITSFHECERKDDQDPLIQAEIRGLDSALLLCAYAKDKDEAI